MIEIGNAYAVRNEIKAAGGKWDGARKVWEVTPEQLAALKADAEYSASRCNKRDTQFGRDWAKVTISGE